MNNTEQQLKSIKDEIEKIKARNQSLEESVAKIHLRNKRVEADKAWELSKTRTIFIAVSTYLLILSFMILIGDNHPSLNAFVASVGYLIAIASYGILKKYWLRKNKA